MGRLPPEDIAGLGLRLMSAMTTMLMPPNELVSDVIATDRSCRELQNSRGGAATGQIRRIWIARAAVSTHMWRPSAVPAPAKADPSCPTPEPTSHRLNPMLRVYAQLFDLCATRKR
jgi:hypothetical protein